MNGRDYIAIIIAGIYNTTYYDYYFRLITCFPFRWCTLIRDTKKCADKISSLERDLAETEAKLEELKVLVCRDL